MHVYFEDRVDQHSPPWEYFVERLKSFGNLEFKEIADDIEFIEKNVGPHTEEETI